MPGVIEVLEVPDGVEGGASLADGQKFTRMYQVEFNGINKFPGAAITASDGTLAIPSYGDLHPESTYAFVIDKNARPTQGGGGYFWDVTVSYGRPTASASPATSPTAPPPAGGGSPPPPPPAIEFQKLDWGFWTKTGAVWEDTAGETIRNSANDMYENQPTREDELKQLTVTRTQSTLDVDWLDYFNNTYNKNAFTISGKSFAAHTLKVNVTASFPSGNNNSWEVKIVIKHDPEGWDWDLLNAGYNFKDLTSPTGLSPIYIKGQRPTKPVLLDATGAVLAAGGTPTYKKFLKYYSSDFAYLGLGY